MKKNYFKILIVIAFTIYNTLNLNAQCTPDLSHKTSGVIPAVLPAGNVGQSYEQVLQFYIVKDTVVTIPGSYGSVPNLRINGKNLRQNFILRGLESTGTAEWEYTFVTSSNSLPSTEFYLPSSFKYNYNGTYIDFPALTTEGTGSDSCSSLWSDMPLNFTTGASDSALYGVLEIKNVGAAPIAQQQFGVFLNIEQH
jgi:hypothetical protein